MFPDCQIAKLPDCLISPTESCSMQIEKNADKLVKTLRVFIQDQPGYLGRLCSFPIPHSEFRI